MSQDSDELVVATTGGIYVAPVGTTLPTNESSALTAYTELGYTTEDGVTFGTEQSVEEIKAWQSRDAIRRLLTERSFTASAELMQWNADTFRIAFGGEVSQVAAGHYRFDFLDDADALEEHVVILKFVDAHTYLLVLPRVTLNDGTETNLNRTSAGTLPISLQALKPDGNTKTAFLLTDDPAFAAGS